MPADISRLRFDALRDFAALELKQGAVLLDSDANEGALIVERQLRALASAVLGEATVGQTTPNAFFLEVGGTSLLIGKGRMYVDGLLAENHGLATSAAVFDPLLAEPAFSHRIPLEAQPYLPVFPPLPQSGRHLVYLDVWQREVTHVESPNLVESAVGVETSARLQTVWQVKVLGAELPNATTCETPDAAIPDWSDLIAPSTGTLTTGTFEVPASEDPCELPPTGGYRGLENQLYRVEIHAGGQLDAGATFKWSRENASVASLVSAVAGAGELELESLGRDDVLGFKTGDLVEILDDATEFSLVSGELRRITVDPDARSVSFAPDLPAALVAAGFKDRRLRVRRWDRTKVFRLVPNGPPVLFHDPDASPGLAIPVPPAGTTLLLEHGITVTFGAPPNTKGFKPGDYWLFAARTADTSVERLTDAPPRGIHHHYARLGIWEVGVGVSDCRVKWPPLGSGADHCACAVCVSEESHQNGTLTIQDAVDSVKVDGGVVCIGAGVYVLKQPVVLAGARGVRIRGQGTATLLRGDAIFVLQSTNEVSIESMRLLSTGNECVISVLEVSDLCLRDLFVIKKALIADRVPSAVALAGQLSGIRVARSYFAAPVGIRANDPLAPAPLPPAPPAANVLLARGLEIDGNVFECEKQAISLNHAVFFAQPTRVAQNLVFSRGDPAFEVVGGALGGVGTVSVVDNVLFVERSAIRVGAAMARINGNHVAPVARRPPTDPAGAPIRTVGIDVVVDPTAKRVETCEIIQNRVRGFTAAIAFAEVGDLLAKQNTLLDCDNGIIQATSARTGALSIENNHLSRIGQENRGAARTFGIQVSGAQSCTIGHNSIFSFGNAPAVQLRAAIAVYGVRRVRITGNELQGIASGEFAGRCFGIMIRAPYDDFIVTGNRVARDAGTPGSSTAGSWSGIDVRLFDIFVDAFEPGDLEFATFRLDTSRILVFADELTYVTDFSDGDGGGNAAPGARGPSGSVIGNSVTARGTRPAVNVSSVTDCMVSDNRIDLTGDVPAVVTLATRGAAIVNANRVRGGAASIRIGTAPSFTVLGNVTTAPIKIGTADLAAPWKDLNVKQP